MKLAEHVDNLRKLIEGSFDKYFSKLGLGASKQIDTEKLPEKIRPKRIRFNEMIQSHIGETRDYPNAREKLFDELTFTLFNRLAAIKVMEAVALFPPILTKQKEHGDRSFGHKAWLEQNPHMKSVELEGIREYLKSAFNKLGEIFPLYGKNYPYALLPDAISLNDIIDAFNAVEADPQIEDEIWKSDDVLGWLYESYNNAKKVAHKESKDKTEYNKVSLQSQVYTPRWVVQFLVENSLGKMYLEMYPDSEIKRKYKIANAPSTQVRKPKPLHEIKVIDPACGSGNFVLYAFDFFYELYMDQIDNFGADYEEKDIPKLIIENNIHGIDLDDRAVQLAQLGLFIKAKRKNRNLGELNFKVVSSDFYLPDYKEVEEIFAGLEDQQKSNDLFGFFNANSQKDVMREIWSDLQFAHKFGSLIRVDEKMNGRLRQLEEDFQAGRMDIFDHLEQASEENFVARYFVKLQNAVKTYTQKKGQTFLSSKTQDAITFLELLTTKYDVACANPPYTDSSDFGPDLKAFIEGNYKKPYGFHTNLYATFIKRCYDLIDSEGFVAMVHPPTFMYIKTFEDVRKFMIDKNHMSLFVEWGYLGMFNPSARVDSAMYVLKKTDKINTDAVFIKLNHLYETKRYDALFEAYDRLLANESHEILYSIPQEKLKIIKSWPFIYWISDEFRTMFGNESLVKYFYPAQGMSVSNSERFLRFGWEICSNTSYNSDTIDKWVLFPKGGPYKKWSGNLWLFVNWANNGYELRSYKKAAIRNDKYYFQEGITYSSSGSKGASFRYLPHNSVISGGGPGIYKISSEFSILYCLGYLNSKIASYVVDCLNPTVNTTQGDLSRVPIISIKNGNVKHIENLVLHNIKISDRIRSNGIFENNFINTPINSIISDVKSTIQSYLNLECELITHILINEAVINETILKNAPITDHDKAMVLAKEGESIGGLPVSPEARTAYLVDTEATKDFPLDNIKDFIESLPTKDFTPEEREVIEAGFPTLYQSNNDLEEFCIRHKINPINVWYWFKESKVIPKQRMNTLAMEFLVDMVREILMEDDDGIIPLVPNAGEKILIDRVEEKFQEKGFISAQYSSFDSVLGKSIPEYLNKHFFAELSDHLNLFMYLPKTPFIWHLSSGPDQGFDCYIIIYKWSRDKLMRLRSVYIENRERALMNRQSDLSGKESAEAQNEKDKIFRQLKEIESFKAKIDELLAEGYNPILDDGVGKNIAPLQMKKMITYEVLNPGQLKKYLNADW